jgi:hypothetical protein
MPNFRAAFNRRAIDHLSVTASEHRDFEAELPDAAAHAINGSVVLSGIARVEDQVFDRPLLNILRSRLINHVHTSSTC